LLLASYFSIGAALLIFHGEEADIKGIRNLIALLMGVRELCWNNFGNNYGAKESRIIPEF